jgi:hypothetical protein
MVCKQSLIVFGLVFGCINNAQAKLTSYSANNVDFVSMENTYSDISWSSDANLLGTMMSNQGYNTVVNAIIATSPTVTDTPNMYVTSSGIYNISNKDFSSSSFGSVSWFGAKAFVKYLNFLNYGGSDKWQLANATEFSLLLHDELNVPRPIGYSLSKIPDTNYFVNEQGNPTPYWCGVPCFDGAGFPSNNNGAYLYQLGSAALWNTDKLNQLQVWTVIPGQISAVPLPSAVWMMGSVMFGLFRMKRRNCN